MNGKDKRSELMRLSAERQQKASQIDNSSSSDNDDEDVGGTMIEEEVEEVVDNIQPELPPWKPYICHLKSTTTAIRAWIRWLCYDEDIPGMSVYEVLHERGVDYWPEPFNFQRLILQPTSLVPFPTPWATYRCILHTNWSFDAVSEVCGNSKAFHEVPMPFIKKDTIHTYYPHLDKLQAKVKELYLRQGVELYKKLKNQLKARLRDGLVGTSKTPLNQLLGGSDGTLFNIGKSFKQLTPGRKPTSFQSEDRGQSSSSAEPDRSDFETTPFGGNSRINTFGPMGLGLNHTPLQVYANLRIPADGIPSFIIRRKIVKRQKSAPVNPHCMGEMSISYIDPISTDMNVPMWKVIFIEEVRKEKITPFDLLNYLKLWMPQYPSAFTSIRTIIIDRWRKSNELNNIMPPRIWAELVDIVCSSLCTHSSDPSDGLSVRELIRMFEPIIMHIPVRSSNPDQPPLVVPKNRARTVLEWSDAYLNLSLRIPRTVLSQIPPNIIIRIDDAAAAYPMILALPSLFNFMIQELVQDSTTTFLSPLQTLKRGMITWMDLQHLCQFLIEKEILNNVEYHPSPDDSSSLEALRPQVIAITSPHCKWIEEFVCIMQRLEEESIFNGHTSSEIHPIRSSYSFSRNVTEDSKSTSRILKTIDRIKLINNLCNEIGIMRDQLRPTMAGLKTVDYTEKMIAHWLSLAIKRPEITVANKIAHPPMCLWLFEYDHLLDGSLNFVKWLKDQALMGNGDKPMEFDWSPPPGDLEFDQHDQYDSDNDSMDSFIADEVEFDSDADEDDKKLYTTHDESKLWAASTNGYYGQILQKTMKTSLIVALSQRLCNFIQKHTRMNCITLDELEEQLIEFRFTVTGVVIFGAEAIGNSQLLKLMNIIWPIDFNSESQLHPKRKFPQLKHLVLLGSPFSHRNSDSGAPFKILCKNHWFYSQHPKRLGIHHVNLTPVCGDFSEFDKMAKEHSAYIKPRVRHLLKLCLAAKTTSSIEVMENMFGTDVVLAEYIDKKPESSLAFEMRHANAKGHMEFDWTTTNRIINTARDNFANDMIICHSGSIDLASLSQGAMVGVMNETRSISPYPVFKRGIEIVEVGHTLLLEDTGELVRVTGCYNSNREPLVSAPYDPDGETMVYLTKVDRCSTRDATAYVSVKLLSFGSVETLHATSCCPINILNPQVGENVNNGFFLHRHRINCGAICSVKELSLVEPVAFLLLIAGPGTTLKDIYTAATHARVSIGIIDCLEDEDSNVIHKAMTGTRVSSGIQTSQLHYMICSTLADCTSTNFLSDNTESIAPKSKKGRKTVQRMLEYKEEVFGGYETLNVMDGEYVPIRYLAETSSSDTKQKKSKDDESSEEEGSDVDEVAPPTKKRSPPEEVVEDIEEFNSDVPDEDDSSSDDEEDGEPSVGQKRKFSISKFKSMQCEEKRPKKKRKTTIRKKPPPDTDPVEEIEEWDDTIPMPIPAIYSPEPEEDIEVEFDQ